jgi:mannose-6-phosphate isomerase-like protein (cupin superfamily)
MGFTVRNLKDVKDAAPAFGLSPDLEARFAREPLESKKVAVSYQRLQPNVRLPFGHKHAGQEEIYVVLEGSAHAKVEDEIVDLGQWDALRVDPETMRGIEPEATCHRSALTTCPVAGSTARSVFGSTMRTEPPMG